MQRFCLASFNILHPDYAYPHRYPHCDEKDLAFDHRWPLIVEQVRGADVIALQEVNLEHYNLYKSTFPEYHVVFQDLQRKQKELDKWRESQSDKRKPNVCVVATLVLAARFSVEETVSKSRSLTTIVRDVATAKRFGVTNVHLEANRDGSHDVSVVQTKHVESIHNFLLNRGGMPHLVVGDFNNFPDTPPLQYLESRQFLRVKNGIPTFSTFNRSESIDHCLYTPDLQCNLIDCSDVKVLIPNQHFPSDHLAVRYSVATVKS